MKPLLDSSALAGLVSPGTIRARMTGRSWWLVRYRDGTVIREWDGPDWSLLPRRGLVAVRLVCPNGKVAELGNSIDASDRLFQFKVGLVFGARRSPTAHLIGIVDGPDGRCRCAAWEYDPGRLVTFDDNVHLMRYQGIGPLAFDHVGIRP